MWRLRDLRRSHGVMVMQRWWLRSRGTHHPNLPTPRFVQLLFFVSSHHCSCPAVICWVIEESSNIVNKQWIQRLCNLFSVCKIQRTIKGNPGPDQLLGYLQVKRHAYQTPLRCIGPIFTTCRVFSLFRIPSRRPRVMPATFRSLVPLIMWLSMVLSANHHQCASSWRWFRQTYRLS